MSICECGKNNCILKSVSSLDSYRNRTIAKTHIKEPTCACCLNQKKIHESRESYMIPIKPPNFKVNIRSSKCQLAKQLIDCEIFHDDISSANRKFARKLAYCEEAFDRETVQNLKLKELVSKNLKQLNDKDKTIQQHAEREKDDKTEIKSLKRMIEKLKKCIVNDTDSNKDDDENDETDQNDDETGENEPNENDNNYNNFNNSNNDKIIDEKDEPNEENKAIDILKTFQKLKNYLVEHDISLKNLCYRNNMTNKRRIFNRFIQLKLNRNDIAHPECDENIKNDNEFFNLLNDY